MSRQEQLDWQARWARPAAVAAFLAVVASIVQVVLPATVIEDRPGIRSLPDSYLSVDENSAPFLVAGAARVIGALALVVVFYYLFKLIRARGGAVPAWFVYLVVAGPVLFALAQGFGAIDQVDNAQQFADQEVVRGEAGENVAERIQDDVNPVLIGISSAGQIAVAFLFVMLPLRARTVGLLSPFMSILGVIAGALIVLPIAPAPIIQAFWLGAVGALFLGHWPGGRGPSWETGEAAPWPSPAQRRGLAPGPDEKPPNDSLLGPPESNGSGEPPEAAPDRPSSRKRRRKR